MKKYWKIIVPAGFFLLVTGVSLSLWKIKKDRALLEIFANARNALYEARKSEANIYSASAYHESMKLFESAMQAWNRENQRFFLRRDYQHARALAGQSAEKAGDAAEKALHNSRDLKGRIVQGQSKLKSEIRKNDELLSILPIHVRARAGLNHGMMNLAESEAAYRNGQYLQSWDRLQEAEISIHDALRYVDGYMEDWFSNYQTWQKWIEQSLKHSISHNSPVIVIDKIGRKASVYRNGKPAGSFPVELGENWIGRKKFMGDKATPEGQYSVVSKKQQPQTRYHKALLLDYPNKEDMRRFRQNKQNGVIEEGAEIGGSIEIHGMGGKGVDWTDGCIALKNQDMDKLYGMVREGTWVTIVGSTRPLPEIWK